MNLEINIPNTTIIIDTSKLIFLCFRRVPHFFIDNRFAASLALFLCTLVSLVSYSYVVARMKNLDLERLVLFSEEVGSVREL